MADGGKKRGLSPEDWADCRKRYEGGESIASLSRRFGVRRQTIMERAKREAWTVHVTAHVSAQGSTVAKVAQERAQAKVIDIATGKAVDALQQSGAIDSLATQVAEELLATSTAGRLAAQAMVSMLEKLRDGLIEPASSPGEQNEAQVYKDAMSAYRTFQTTVRENHALGKSQPSIPKDDSKGKKSKIKFTIARPTGTEG